MSLFRKNCTQKQKMIECMRDYEFPSNSIFYSSIKEVAFIFGVIIGGILFITYPFLCSLANEIFVMKHFYWTLLCVGGFVSLHYFHQVLFLPLEYSRYCNENEKAHALQRSYADLLPAFPNSWSKLLDDFMLEKGKTVQVELFGRQLRVKRLKSGVLNPFCVDEHNGQYPIAEVNRIIFVWYHNDPDFALTPLWEIPIIDNGMKDWIFHGKVEHDIVCHISETAENGADTAHLEYVHGAFLLQCLFFIRHYWTCEYKTKNHSEVDAHIAKIDIVQYFTFFGYRLPFTTVRSDIRQVGPNIVQLIFPTIFGNILVQETIQPLHTNLQRANNIVHAQRNVPRFIAKFILKSLAIQFERDLPIWNAKRWLRKPLIIKSDGPIQQYRRWMKQFYANNGGKCIRSANGVEMWIENEKKKF
jgi:hypothetical protein